ncbi:hypothetical protein AC249_AIPGENE1713 [Exaiptasia diaphana]|nr:hypothetical protein AC249_AIPGENE1713 [Exaiptasia diaphana]
MKWQWKLSKNNTNLKDAPKLEIKRYKEGDKNDTVKTLLSVASVTSGIYTSDDFHYLLTWQREANLGRNGYAELTIHDVMKQSNNKDGTNVDVMKANYTYSCHLSEPFDNDPGPRSTTLVVYKIATIVGVPPNQYITSTNQSVTLRCIADGKPAPVINWDVTKVSGQPSTFSGSELVLDPFRKEDAGVYSCTVWNHVGNATFVAVLLQFTKCSSGCSSDDQIAIKMTELTNTNEYGNPNSTEYKKLKRAIEEALKITYPNGVSCSEARVPIVDALKTGKFAGQAVKKSFITLLPKAAPHSVTAAAKTSQSILIKWQVPVIVRCSTGVGYKVVFTTAPGESGQEVLVSGFHNTSYILTNLAKGTDYYISVKVHNEKGDGPPSDVIKERTLEDGAYRQPNAETKIAYPTTKSAVTLKWGWSVETGITTREVINKFEIRTGSKLASKKTIAIQFAAIDDAFTEDTFFSLKFEAGGAGGTNGSAVFTIKDIAKQEKYKDGTRDSNSTANYTYSCHLTVAFSTDNPGTRATTLIVSTNRTCSTNPPATTAPDRQNTSNNSSATTATDNRNISTNQVVTTATDNKNTSLTPDIQNNIMAINLPEKQNNNTSTPVTTAPDSQNKSTNPPVTTAPDSQNNSTNSPVTTAPDSQNNSTNPPTEFLLFEDEFEFVRLVHGAYRQPNAETKIAYPTTKSAVTLKWGWSVETGITTREVINKFEIRTGSKLASKKTIAIQFAAIDDAFTEDTFFSLKFEAGGAGGTNGSAVFTIKDIAKQEKYKDGTRDSNSTANYTYSCHLTVAFSTDNPGTRATTLIVSTNRTCSTNPPATTAPDRQNTSNNSSATTATDNRNISTNQVVTTATDNKNTSLTPDIQNNIMAINLPEKQNNNTSTPVTTAPDSQNKSTNPPVTTAPDSQNNSTNSPVTTAPDSQNNSTNPPVTTAPDSQNNSTNPPVIEAPDRQRNRANPTASSSTMLSKLRCEIPLLMTIISAFMP